MLKHREDGDQMLIPSREEIVRMFEDVLSDLTVNSKQMIREITGLADEWKEFSEGIAYAICDRILEVPDEQKLPSLYLLDSIVKSIGHDYMRYFAARLPEVFCVAYKQAHPRMHLAMRQLFRTWPRVFPSSVLRKIEAELQFSPHVIHQSSILTTLRSESPSPRAARGIHVNPKYLEAQRQYEPSTSKRETDPPRNARMTDFGGERMKRPASASPKGWSGASPKFHDVQHPRGVSSTSSVQIYGQKRAVEFGKYDYDPAEGLSPQIGAVRLFPPSKNKHLQPSLPSKIGPERSLSPPSNGFARDISPGRIIKRASPSEISDSGFGFGFGVGRLSERDGGRTVFWGKHYSVDGTHQMETSITGSNNLNSESDGECPRALINAYGNEGKNISHGKHLKIEPLDENCINSKVPMRKWQNSEEEEYVWEDMRPILVDCSRSNGFTSFDSHQMPSSRRTDFSLLEPNFVRAQWPSQTKLSLVDFPVNINEDRISIPTWGDGFVDEKSKSHTGTQKEPLEQFKGFHYAQKPSNLPNQFPQSSQSYLPLKPEGRALQSAFPAKQIVSSVCQKMPHLVDKSQFNFPDVNELVVNHVPTNSSKPLQLPYQLSGLRPPNQPSQGIPSTSFYLQGSAMPRVPLGLSASSQIRSPSVTTDPNISHPPQSAFSGLLSSLVSRGLISLTTPASSQDILGVEFDAELLKVRHESVINALYVDLLRQCTTCGLRFKYQEEHSNHMDWHVTKNRVSKNRKQNASRKWYVSTKEWLSGMEILGNEVVPVFLPTEPVEEKRGSEEMVVPADENQTVCALCEERFEDFYSDETDEWMYKGAVYLNAFDGSRESMERSRLGPIVHVKCRPDSTVGSP